jgi:replication initiation protein RepC
LHDEVVVLLENHVNEKNPSANEALSEPQQQNSNTNSSSDLEPGFRDSQGVNLDQP